MSEFLPLAIVSHVFMVFCLDETRDGRSHRLIKGCGEICKVTAHFPCTTDSVNIMKRSLTTQFFFAFVASASLIIAMLTAAVIWSMHDGFSRYLLQEELGLFAEMAETLGQRYDPADPNWPVLANNPDAWREFVAEHYAHPKVESEKAKANGPPSIESKLFLLDATGSEIISPAGERKNF